MKLNIDKEHVIIPTRYNGLASCGFDIAIVKVPEQYVSEMLEYLEEHQMEDRFDKAGLEAFKQL